MPNVHSPATHSAAKPGHAATRDFVTDSAAVSSLIVMHPFRALLLLLGWPLISIGAIRSEIGITIPQRGGGTALTANVYAPDVAPGAGPYPVISMLPGGGAALTSTEWAAQRLARDGYVVCLTLPQGSGEDLYSNACVSGLDFLASAANPFLAESDNARAGVCGWSLGGRSLTKTQEEDARVKCLVAWDNLAVSEKGDGGSALGANRPQRWRTPRVPAMGQASLNGFTDSECKITAWKWWREFGMPCMQVVFAGSNHYWRSGTASTELKREQAQPSGGCSAGNPAGRALPNGAR